MTNAISMASGSILTLGFCVGIARASEKRVDFNDLPPAVQKTAQRESRGLPFGVTRKR